MKPALMIEGIWHECPFCEGTKQQGALACVPCDGKGELLFIPPATPMQALFTIYPKSWPRSQ
jgi:hypothetical protein